MKGIATHSGSGTSPDATGYNPNAGFSLKGLLRLHVWSGTSPDATRYKRSGGVYPRLVLTMTIRFAGQSYNKKSGGEIVSPPDSSFSL